MNISSVHQHAAKKEVGSEDCVIPLTTEISTQFINGILIELATFDSSEAYDAQQQILIRD